MSDPGTRAADAAVERLERHLRRIYAQAQKEVQEKLDEFLERSKARQAVKLQELADNKITQTEYEIWMRGQVFQGKQWQAKLDQITQTLVDADKAALKMIQGETQNVFAENATYQSYAMEHEAGLDLGFGIYDSATVARLIKEQPDLLPKSKLNIPKDKQWNRKNILNCVTQGIIQGEGIPKIAARIAKETGSRDRKAMERTARTAMTGAQNAGRIEAMQSAQDMGIEVKKKWMATFDFRTREAHGHLDGQVQDVDKPFKSMLGDIMYPGDTTGAPANFYNCRCTLGWVYPKYPSKVNRRDNINGELLGDMTYDEWKKYRETGKKPDQIEISIKESYQYHATKYSSLTGIAENGLRQSRGHVGSGVYLAETEKDALEWTSETSTGGTAVLRISEEYLKKHGELEKWSADETGYGLAENVYKGNIPLEYIQIKVNDNGDDYDWWSLAQFIKNSRRRYSMLSKKAQRRVDDLVHKELRF